MKLLLVLGAAGALANSDTLRYGSPSSVGMKAQPLHDMVANLTHFTETRNWTAHSYNQIVPIQPGGVTLVAHKGVIVSHFAFGERNRWGALHNNTGTLLPPNKREKATLDTIYDMASLTKMFTTVAWLRCWDRGLVGLNDKVVKYLPDFAANGKENVTMLQLLTHTSGFPPDPAQGLWEPQFKTYAEQVKYIVTQPLVNPPGTAYVYSDINFMNVMLVVEKITGKKLDENIAEYTVPLGMHTTFFNRGDVAGRRFKYYGSMATQEFQEEVGLEVGTPEPKREQPVRGTVHDENAYGLDGVSGHAGLFSTARDTATFCQMILNNGTYGGHRVLSQKAVDMIFTNYLGYLGEDHGVGFELNQYYTSGPMANMLAASHTGFTGTSLVVDRASNTLFVHMSNRVHPTREWSSNNIVRETLGAWVATALGRDVAFPI